MERKEKKKRLYSQSAMEQSPRVYHDIRRHSLGGVVGKDPARERHVGTTIAITILASQLAKPLAALGYCSVIN